MLVPCDILYALLLITDIVKRRLHVNNTIIKLAFYIRHDHQGGPLHGFPKRRHRWRKDPRYVTYP